MFFTLGQGGMADWLRDVSYGGVDLSGSVVRGWFAMSIASAEGQAQDRNQRWQSCLDAARNGGYQPPTTHRVAVITAPSTDLFGWLGGAPGGFPGGAYLPWDVDVGAMAHEALHGIGLNHSFSDDPTYQNASWAAIGEYDDPWDVMSWANAFRVPTVSFGTAPVGLNAFHVDRSGWIPRDRILRFSAGGERNATVTLAALNNPSAQGFLLLRIPFDPGDLGRHYTVELRRQAGWDAGVPRPIVLIREVRRIGNGAYHSFLLRERGGDRAPVQSLSANGVRIQIGPIDTAAGTATVTVQADIAVRCVQGFVWREAGPDDVVCVSPQVREETRQENTLAASRREPGGGSSGPDTCRQGFVWREAFPGDVTCVPPASRTRASQDNAQAADRNNPARHAFGPNTCQSGFVWREADLRDWVCVSPQTRAETLAENGAGPSRREPGGGPFGPDTCRQGFVWRDAFVGDHVCVPPVSRARARDDNAQASARLLFP